MWYMRQCIHMCRNVKNRITCHEKSCLIDVFLRKISGKIAFFKNISSLKMQTYQKPNQLLRQALLDPWLAIAD